MPIPIYPIRPSNRKVLIFTVSGNQVDMSFQEFEPIFHNLNEEFNNLKGKINILMNRFSDLEKQLKSNSKAKFRCSKCNKYFESMDNFQKHKEKNEICDANLYPYQCEKCELLFTSEKQ